MDRLSVSGRAPLDVVKSPRVSYIPGHLYQTMCSTIFCRPGCKSLTVGFERPYLRATHISGVAMFSSKIVAL
jgi:hypothetical protein